VIRVPTVTSTAFEWRDAAPDPLEHPEYYEGVILRRVLGHLVDVFLVCLLIFALGIFFVVLGLLSLGLLWVPLLMIGPAVTLAYDASQVGGRHSATLGMRLLGIEVRSWTGARPELPQAFVRALLFWGLSYMTATLLMWLVLGFALFNTRRRCLHDYLSGTVVIRTSEQMVLRPSGR